MNPLAELDQLNLKPAAKNQAAALLQALLDQAAQDAKTIEAKEADIQAKDLKIGALTYELAYYKRIRFSRKNESLAPLQRDVFEEAFDTDIAAIQAEVEQLQDDPACDTAVRPKRPRAPAANPYRIICPASSTVTNPNLALAVNAARTWSRSAKTSPNNWTLNRPNSLSIVISVHNMPVGLAKPSRRRRFPRQ